MREITQGKQKRGSDKLSIFSKKFQTIQSFQKKIPKKRHKNSKKRFKNEQDKMQASRFIIKIEE